MKLAVTYPDAEKLVKAYLADELDALGETVTVTVGVPASWTPASLSNIQVDSDGVPLLAHPVLAHNTIRLVARAASTTEAKRLAALAQGVLLAHPGGGGIASTRPLTGVLPARDPQTHAELASTTSRVTVRSIPIEPSGS
jgi:hypothetical protein